MSPVRPDVRALADATADDRVSLLTPELRELLYGPLRAPAIAAPLVPEAEVPPSAEPEALVDGGQPTPTPTPAATRRPPRRLVRRLVRRITSLAATLAVGAVLLLTVGPLVLPFHSFFIRSGSMKPGLPVGSLVVSTRAAASDLHVGDVISFDRPDHPGDVVTHRIVAIEDVPGGRQFVTQGDANSVPDPWRVPAVGDGWKYDFSVPYAGYVIGYTRMALAAIGERGAVAILCAVFALTMIWRSPARDDEAQAAGDVAA